MKIRDTQIFFIDKSDIDANGILDIPAFITNIAYKLQGHLSHSKLRYISRTENGQQKLYPVEFYNNQMYIVLNHRPIMGHDIKILAAPKFNTQDMHDTKHVIITYNGKAFIADTIAHAINDIRTDIWQEKIYTNAAQCGIPTYMARIVSDAINQTILANRSRAIGVPLRRYIDAQIDNLSSFLHGINRFCIRYTNNDALDELSTVTLQELANIVLPIQSHNIGKSYTRFAKHNPDSAAHVHAAMTAGFKNPGCFPYDWIKEIPKSERGRATDELHAAFRTATMKLYTPTHCSYSFVQSRYDNVLNNLARQIEQITHVPVKIEYYGHGFFSKTYKITSERDAYILKVYHSDLPYKTSQQYAHDIDAQNSFLISGKKYCGKIKYRTVLTAGISNQRGQRYILYPFVDGTPCNIQHNPYDCFKTHQFCDNIGKGNLCNNTIIDIGMLKTNTERIGRPYMTKIINTILYRPWDDLAIVLNKYSPAQISYTIEYMKSHMTSGIPNHKCICEKIEFLKNRTSNNR